jgi:hypothetical protein
LLENAFFAWIPQLARAGLWVRYKPHQCFCQSLTKRERKAVQLLKAQEYRPPPKAEGEFECRGSSRAGHHLWWGNKLKAGEGGRNIAAVDIDSGGSSS